MLLQLTPNQVTAHWDEIKEHLQYALAPQMEVNEKALNRILRGLVSGTSQAWIIVGDEDDCRTIYAMGLTCFSTEMATDTKNLLIYSLSGYRHIPENLWVGALAHIKAFAKSNGCFRVIAFTQVSRIVDIAKVVGGDTATRLIYWEV